MIDSKVLRQIQAINWDFPGELPGVSKNMHWYPGTFPAQLPAAVIEALSGPNDIVVDPFGGVGTSAAEAIRLGRRAWSVDSNLIASLAAYVATGFMLLCRHHPVGIDHVLSRIASKLYRESAPLAAGLGLRAAHGGVEFDEFLSVAMRPTPSDMLSEYMSDSLQASLSTWYDRRTLEDILGFRAAVLGSRMSTFEKLVTMLMISSSMRFSSSQTKSWGHVADNVLPKAKEQKNFYKVAGVWLSRVRGQLERSRIRGHVSASSPTSIQAWIACHNWKEGLRGLVRPRSSSTLLVTSPPYGDAIDYTLSQRLSMYLFGVDDQQLAARCQEEIGARRRRFSSSSRSNWAIELGDALTVQLQTLSESSNVVLVLPHKDAGREIGAEAISLAMEAAGFSLLSRIDRSIRQARARQSWTSILRETIEIYSR